MSHTSFYGILLSVLLLVTAGTNAFGQTFEWAHQTGAAGWDEGTSVKTGPDQAVYVTGLFAGTVDFDPGPAFFYLTAVEDRDAFIYKLDAAGALVWAKQYGDSAFIGERNSLAIDLSGNLYITNSFLGTVDFDPDFGSFQLTSPGSDRAVFVQKLDADGNFVWAKQIGAPFVPAFPTPAHSNAIAVDAVGDVYLTGYFDGTTDFDPHPDSVFTLTSQFNASDAFVCKLDTDGNFGWAKQFTGTQSHGGVGYGIALDDSGNCYSTGTIGGTVDLDPGLDTFYLTTSAFPQPEMYVSKLDALGNFVWARAMGPGEGSAIATDGDHAIYSSGWAPSGYTAVVNKHDAAGNLLWAKAPGGLNGQSIAVDQDGNVYTAGLCFGTNDFDPGLEVVELTGGTSDSYISKLDSAGNFLWAGLLTGTNQVWVNGITTDADDNVYTTGFFNGTADFDPSVSATAFTGPADDYDVFLAKLSEDATLALAEDGFAAEVNVSPNPTDGQLVVACEGEHGELQLVLRTVQGQVVATHVVQAGEPLTLHVDGASGIYLLELSDTNAHTAVMKILKR